MAEHLMLDLPENFPELSKRINRKIRKISRGE
jgi:hypothetical protein